MSIAEKLTMIAENEQRVFEAGKKSEYDAFWDNYQENGNKTNYRNGFCGKGWNDNILNPKYIVKTNSAYMMFFFGDISFDPTSHPKFDFSECQEFTQWLCNTNVSSIKKLDVTKTTAGARFVLNNMPKLKTVEKFIVGSTPVRSNYFQECFTNTPELENITFEGEICYNINMSPCKKLTKASIDSAFEHLSTAHTFTLTLSKTAVDKAYETSEGANDGSTNLSSEWQNRVNGKPSGVTVSLA